MSCLSETSLSLLASAPPTTSNATYILLGALVFTAVAYIVYYASPTRLTPILVTAIAETEKTYLEALEAGVLPKSDADTATTLTSLQIKVSNIREATLRHSLSYRAALCAFLKGRTLTVLYCIRDVHRLETHIEARLYFSVSFFDELLTCIASPQILKEAHLRAADPASESATRTHFIGVGRKSETRKRRGRGRLQPWEFYDVISADLGKLVVKIGKAQRIFNRDAGVKFAWGRMLHGEMTCQVCVSPISNCF
ncbi:hypothetical protein FB451DRAFT_1501240 [Mycena latifolia]|nr:hypothetical protein FB451DRAFT_1501240 [Mycena latifolia]